MANSEKQEVLKEAPKKAKAPNYRWVRGKKIPLKK